MVPCELTVWINIVSRISKTASAGRGAGTECVAVAQPVVTQEETVSLSGRVVDSARCFFAVKQISEGLRLLTINRDAVAHVWRDALNHYRIKRAERCVNLWDACHALCCNCARPCTAVGARAAGSEILIHQRGYGVG